MPGRLCHRGVGASIAGGLFITATTAGILRGPPIDPGHLMNCLEFGAEGLGVAALGAEMGDLSDTTEFALRRPARWLLGHQVQHRGLSHSIDLYGSLVAVMAALLIGHWKPELLGLAGLSSYLAFASHGLLDVNNDRPVRLFAILPFRVPATNILGAQRQKREQQAEKVLPLIVNWSFMVGIASHMWIPLMPWVAWWSQFQVKLGLGV